MPKLRAIDFNKIKNGNIDEARRVVKDLLMLTPRGPNQNLRGKDYFKFDASPGKEAILTSHQNYVDHFAREDAQDYNFGWSNSRRSEWWGYTNEQLYFTAKTLGAQGTWVGESDFRDVLRKAFPEVYHNYRSAKLTRGSRRLTNRFSTAWSEAIKGGKIGDLAFKCSISTPQIERRSYGGPTIQTSLEMSFACRTQEEAKMMLATTLGHAVDDTDVSFSAWQAAEPADILARNVEQLTRLARAKEKANEEMAQLQQFLNNIDMLEEAVQMYSMTICE